MKTLLRFFGGLVAMLLMSTASFAAVFNYVVDHTGDNAAQACTGAAADCSFRSALQLAGTDGDTTAITFLASLYGGGAATITAGSNWDNVFTGTTITGPGSGNIVLDMNSQADMLWLSSNDNITITGLTIKNSKTYQCVSGTGSNLTITSNIILNCRTEGIAIGDGTAESNITISGNTITNYGLAGSGTGSSQGIDVGYDHDTVTIASNNVGTTTSATPGDAIFVAAAATNVTIGGNNPSDGNTVTFAGVDAIRSASPSSVIKNNTISNAATYGIQVSGDNFTVTSNTISNSAYGIEVDEDSATVSNNVITGSTQIGILVMGDNNVFSGDSVTSSTVDGIAIYKYLTYVPTGNSFTNETITTSATGILFDGAGTTNNTFTGITISGSSANDVAQTNTDAGNINYLVNTNFSSYSVTSGTLDVNFNTRAYATQAGTSTGLASSAITYSKNGGVSTSLGTTNGSGYTSYVSLDGATITSAGRTNDSYIFASQHNIGYHPMSATTITSATGTVTITHPGQQYSGDDDDDDDDTTEVIAPPVEPIDEPVVEPPLPEILGLPVLVEDETEKKIEEKITELEPIVVVEKNEQEEKVENIEEQKIVEESVNTVTSQIEKVVEKIYSKTSEKPKEETLESTIKEYRYIGDGVAITAIGKKVSDVLATDDEETADRVWQTVEDTFTENLKRATGEENVKVIVTEMYDKDELEAEKKQAEADGKEVWELDMNSDYDNDQISDVVAMMYDIPMFNPDSDNDGYTNAEELFLGLDPKKYDKAPTVPAITNLDGQVTGQWPSFRLRGAAGDSVEVTLLNADNDNKVSLGFVVIDSKNKGELNLSYPLVNGTYFAVPKGKAGFGEAVKFTVDKNVELQMPRIVGYEKLSAEELALLKFGNFVGLVLEWRGKVDPSFSVVVFVKEKVESNGVQIVTGYAEPGSVVYLTFKSVVISSVAIADANGKFETRLYASTLDLDAQRHEILAYAADDKRGLVSNMMKFITGNK